MWNILYCEKGVAEENGQRSGGLTLCTRSALGPFHTKIPDEETGTQGGKIVCSNQSHTANRWWASDLNLGISAS